MSKHGRGHTGCKEADCDGSGDPIVAVDHGDRE
jgi:hypothetical protein